MRKLSLKEKTARSNAQQEKIAIECYEVWKIAKAKNPDRYPEERPALNRTQAIYWKGYRKYWSKCKYGHIAERTVEKSSCPVCDKISKSIRSAKIRHGNTVSLSLEEKNLLLEIYEESKKLTSETGIEHHVDHIRPLAAGGVHHPKNLRVVTAKENLKKGSTYNGQQKKYSQREKRELREKFVNELKAERKKNPKTKTGKLDPWSIGMLGIIGCAILIVLFGKK
jgi:hypothetical protein